MHSDGKLTQGNNNYYVVAIRYCRYCTNIRNYVTTDYNK